MPNLFFALGGVSVAETTPVLAGVVTSAMVNGVLDEVIGLLPVLLPAMISFIGIRKGISFVGTILHAA